MINEILYKLSKSIIKVYDKKNKIEYTGKFELVLFKHKFSSSLSENLRLSNNGIILPIIGLQVDYNCPTCNSLNSILLKRFLTKKSLMCKKCCEKDENKKIKQSDYVKSSYNQFGKLVKKETETKTKFQDIKPDELIRISEINFKSESDEFKKNYFTNNLTIEEFEKLKNKIQVSDLEMSKVKYYPFIKTSHSHKYSSKILDDSNELHIS